ncbi:hypothetical protein B0H14DRAFT_2640073 [Mycena olivaceomarginata]|nr:hypothetical protein B0H14DRAFT_2640073 [Mycena olivaceomarginata]
MPFRYIYPQQKMLLPTIKRTVPNNNGIATITDMNSCTVHRTLKNYHNYCTNLYGSNRPRSVTQNSGNIFDPALHVMLLPYKSVQYGDIVPPKMGQVGRPRALNGLDMCYLQGLIECRPDSTTSELCQGLYEGMQIDVDELTITWALHNRGYSFKKVSRSAIQKSPEKRDNYEAMGAQEDCANTALGGQTSVRPEAANTVALDNDSDCNSVFPSDDETLDEEDNQDNDKEQVGCSCKKKGVATWKTGAADGGALSRREVLSRHGGCAHHEKQSMALQSERGQQHAGAAGSAGSKNSVKKRSQCFNLGNTVPATVTPDMLTPTMTTSDSEPLLEQTCTTVMSDPPSHSPSVIDSKSPKQIPEGHSLYPLQEGQPFSIGQDSAVEGTRQAGEVLGAVDLLVCVASAPAWFMDAHGDIIREGLGPHYKMVITVWTQMKQASQFKQGPMNLLSKWHPEHQTWNNPSGPDPAAYTVEWQGWWDLLRPEWRQKEGDGRWSVMDGYRARGWEWGMLYHWGVNSVLSVITSLYFWGCTVRSSDPVLQASWEAAVGDVEGMVTYYKKFNKKF